MLGVSGTVHYTDISSHGSLLESLEYRLVMNCAKLLSKTALEAT
jgi:hypothetical protein